MHSKMDTRSRSVRPMSDVRLIALYFSCRALWSLRLRILQEGLRALAARRRACDGAPDRRANVPAVLVSLCASEGRRVRLRSSAIRRVSATIALESRDRLVAAFS